jgi:hypothetical protein
MEYSGLQNRAGYWKSEKQLRGKRCAALTLRTTCGGNFARWTPPKMSLPQKIALTDMLHATNMRHNCCPILTS